MIKTRLISFLVLMLIFVSACKHETVAAQEPILEISKTVVDFKVEGGKSVIQVHTNQPDVKITTDADWLSGTLNADNSNLTVRTSKYDGLEVREGTIRLAAAQLSVQLKVRQLGAQPAILVSPENMSLPAVGGKFEFTVTANITFDISLPEWIKVPVASRVGGMVTTQHQYVADPCNTYGSRTGNIVITDNRPGVDPKTAITKVIIVSQDGTSKVKNSNTESLKSDIKIPIESGTVSSYQGGAGIELSFDGNKNTLYHSTWNNGGANYFPITLTYNLKADMSIDYLIYVPRTDGSNNGRFKEVDILTSKDGITFTKWKTHDFGAPQVPVKLDFEKGFSAKSIRFVVRSGAGDGQGFASCAEMEFYQKNAQNYDSSILFTDALCTDLKSSVTLEQIEACPDPFYKSLALNIYNKVYSREFRIATFKAYPWPGVQSATHKTNPYSPLDNPTGISVKADEDLVVFVGDTHGQAVSLRVQNLDRPGGDGFGGMTYILHQGMNKIRIQEKGLVYVMYHTNVLDDPTALPIKMHFATGTVNGYFDSQKHTKDDWRRLIDNATDKYFDVLGKYSHCIFETNNYRQYTTNGKTLSDVVDRYSYEEQRLMGLVKYNKMFRNRMLLTVMYHSYMYATSFHTGYNINTMSTLANDVELQGGGVWGPAHEIGHMNQTRPGLRWLGMTEVTNNIMSEYMQTSIFNQPSRLQTENMGGGVNRYTKSWNNIIVRKLAHGAEEDVFCKLVPFWQLELYFGNVLGKTPRYQMDHGGFYPDVYEHVRNTPNLGHGASQVEFCVTASKYSGYDLTDFFTKWGFFTPIDMEIDDYGKAQLTVETSQIEEVKRRIAAMNLPKLTVPIEYITDVNWEYFKKKATIAVGTAGRNENNVTLNNWQNVVAYELKNANNELIYVGDGILAASNTAVLRLPGWQTGYRLYAVQADGKRIEVKL